MKFKTIISLVILFVLSAGLYACGQKDNTPIDSATKIANAYVTLDINPSIEIITGEDGLVVQVNALNDDAQVMLVDTSFAGKTVEETINALVQLATDMGYIEYLDQNAIVVTVQAPTENETTDLEDEITDEIGEVAEENDTPIEVIKPDRAATPEMKAEALALGISLGKLKLIKEAMKFDETLTPEAGATMAVKALNRIIIDARKEMKNMLSEELQNQFMNLKDEAKAAILFGQVQYTNEALQAADDAVFATLLATTTVTAADVKALYQAYYDALLAVKNAEDISDDIKAQIEDYITSGVDVINLFALKETIIQAINELKGQGKDAKDQLKTKLQELKTIRASIRQNLNTYIATLTDDYENIEVNIDENEDGTYDVNVTTCNWDAYKEVRSDYEAQFEELGVGLEALEALFADSIKDSLDVIRNQYNTQIENAKTDAQNQAEGMKNKFREKKTLYQDTFKKDN